MSRLQDSLAERVKLAMRTPAELDILKKYEERTTKFRKLFQNKDFAEYLKLEEEMNDPRIVIAYHCSDAHCESLKAKIRDFWTRQRVLNKLKESNGTGTRAQSHPARR